jgi:hypothetical protein
MQLRFHDLLHHSIIALILLASVNADATIIVSIDNVAMTTGGPSGFIDVTVSWQDPDPGGLGSISSVNVDYFFAKFQIVPVGAVTTSVAFRAFEFDPGPPASFDNGNLEQLDANYLFAGNSLNITLLQSSGTLGGAGNTEFSGGDGRSDFDPNNEPLNLITLTSAPRLLYRFELLTTGTTLGTDLFQLQLLDSPDTDFFDNDGFELAFVSTGGLISVTQGAAAVPEPGTGFMLLLRSGIMAWRTRNRSKVRL